MDTRSNNLARLAGSLIVIGLTVGLVSCSGYGGSGYAHKTASATTTFIATLSGTAEVPPNMSTATGSGTIVVDPASRVLTATVTTTGINGMAAHIHAGGAGVIGPVIFPLTQTPSGSGKWSTNVTLTDAQLATLKTGGYYINVHSAAFPAGEIRGQITAPAGY